MWFYVKHLNMVADFEDMIKEILRKVAKDLRKREL